VVPTRKARGTRSAFGCGVSSMEIPFVAAWSLLPLIAMLVQITWLRKSQDGATDESRWQRLVALSILLVPVLNLFIVAMLST